MEWGLGEWSGGWVSGVGAEWSGCVGRVGVWLGASPWVVDLSRFVFRPCTSSIVVVVVVVVVIVVV